MNLRDEALRYAAAGIPVFPLHWIKQDGTCSCTCDDCGHIVADHQTHAWTHDPDAEDTVAATCLAGGKAGYVCDNCGAAELRDAEKLGHDYVGVQTTAPTCSAAGVMTYTCSRCEDTYTVRKCSFDFFRRFVYTRKDNYR